MRRGDLGIREWILERALEVLSRFEQYKDETEKYIEERNKKEEIQDIPRKNYTEKEERLINKKKKKGLIILRN